MDHEDFKLRRSTPLGLEHKEVDNKEHKAKEISKNFIDVVLDRIRSRDKQPPPPISYPAADNDKISLTDLLSTIYHYENKTTTVVCDGKVQDKLDDAKLVYTETVKTLVETALSTKHKTFELDVDSAYERNASPHFAILGRCSACIRLQSKIEPYLRQIQPLLNVDSTSVNGQEIDCNDRINKSGLKSCIAVANDELSDLATLFRLVDGDGRLALNTEPWGTVEARNRISVDLWLFRRSLERIDKRINTLIIEEPSP